MSTLADFKIFYQLLTPVYAVNDPATLKDLEGVFSKIISGFFALAGFALVIMIIVGGFRILFSAGDPKAVEAGRNTLTWAFTGFALVILAWFFLLLIEAVTGVRVTFFTIPGS